MIYLSRRQRTRTARTAAAFGAALAIIFSMTLVPASSAAPAPPADSAKEILLRSVEALGGEQALAAIESYRVRIERNIRSSVDGVKYVSLTELFRAPNSVRREASIRFAGRGPFTTKILEVYDGAVAWSNDNEKQEMVRIQGGALQRAKTTTLARFSLLRRAARGEAEASWRGREVVSGRAANKVTIQVPNGTVTYLIDAESGRPFRADAAYGEIKETISLDDYRKVGSVTLPFRIVTDSNSYLEHEFMEDRFTEVVINPPLAADSFAAPRGR